MEENKTENTEELDVSRDQATIVSMLRLQALENLLIEKKVIEQNELLERFASINSNFIENLKKFTKELDKTKE